MTGPLLPATDKSVTYSVCPTLGRMHALVVRGFCPSDLQNPSGKEINVAFCLQPPFAISAKAGGSDFLTLQLLARRFGFIPRFIFKILVDSNDSDGLIHSVGFISNI